MLSLSSVTLRASYIQLPKALLDEGVMGLKKKKNHTWSQAERWRRWFSIAEPFRPSAKPPAALALALATEVRKTPLLFY